MKIQFDPDLDFFVDDSQKLGWLQDFNTNPQQYIEQVTAIVKRQVRRRIVDRIKDESISALKRIESHVGRSRADRSLAPPRIIRQLLPTQ